MSIKIKNKLLFALIFIYTVNVYAVDPMVAAGGYYSLFLTEEGTVWQWGGQFAAVNKTDPPTPRQITPLENIIAVAAGRYFSLALDQENQVWAWGSNNHGQLGNGDVSYNNPIPALVKDLAHITQIKAGWFHGLALREDGTLWSWGQNEEGQLGDGTRTTRTLPVQVTDLNNVVYIAAGRNHSLAVTDDGHVWAWGVNETGQLGNGSNVSSSIPIQVKTISNIVSVAATRDHSLALSKEGTVWAWGDDSSGELGDELEIDSHIPVKVKGLKDVVAISAEGWDHSLAITKTGDVWAWGSNQYGKLGDGTEENRSVPVKVEQVGNIIGIATGWGHSLALTKTYQVWSWGNNDHDQLGNINSGEYSVYPVLVQQIALAKPIRCETGCEEGKPCVCFDSLEDEYSVGEQIKLSVTLDTHQIESDKSLDLYVIVGFYVNDQAQFLFLTSDQTFTSTPTPYDPDIVLSESEKLELFDIPVENCMGGDYTLYAAFVNQGDKPEVENVVSNLATRQVTLENICSSSIISDIDQ